MSSREELLRRVRDGLKALPDDDRTVPVPRNYGRHAPDTAPEDRPAIIELFIERLEYYGAQVFRTAEPGVVAALTEALRAQWANIVLAPGGLPEHWLTGWAGIGKEVVTDDPPLTAEELDRVDAVVTTCAGAVADSGTLVLDGGPGQGRRSATLVPGYHICVVRAEQIDPTLPHVLDKLDPRRQITWFGGPSATVDSARTPADALPDLRRLVVLIVE